MKMIRQLNDYESMLAKMTCNVGIQLFLPCKGGEVDQLLKQAWSKCVANYQFLSCHLEERKQNGVGPLGQRYDIFSNQSLDETLFCIQSMGRVELEKELQIVGTTKLDIAKGTYYVECHVDNEATEDGSMGVSIIFSFCHAVSDGPGALQVVHTFLQHLGNEFEKDSETNKSDSSETSSSKQQQQPLIDLQALILGNDYGANTEARANSECNPGMDVIVAELASDKGAPLTVDGVPLLPPEALQTIPQDPSNTDGLGYIDAVHEKLSGVETESLLTKCRSRDTTIQGALTVACLVARMSLLKLSLPLYAAVQVPMNCRGMVAGKSSSVADTCLCGSAGLWHTLVVNKNDKVFEVAKRATQETRRASNDKQQSEWLRRLFHAPATLPPYSFMESSIGVAPIQPTYGNMTVKEAIFFGAALRTTIPSTAQATMVHAVTFDGKLQFAFNFTYPTISQSFAQASALIIKDVLVTMAMAPNPDSLTLSSLLRTTRDDDDEC